MRLLDSRLTALRCAIWLLILDAARSADNATRRFMVLDEELFMRGRSIGSHRKPRFLSFQTTDTEIVVDMQLSVPFLSIPIKTTLDGASGMLDKLHSANLNVGALGLTALMLFGSAFIIPKILNFFSATHLTNHPVRSRGLFGKMVDGEMYWTDHLENELTCRGAPPRQCIGRIMCSMVQKSSEATAAGQASSSDKIIDGLASNEWIMRMFKDTVLHEAIVHSYSRQDCSSKYPECKINQNALDNFIKALSSKLFNI